jgi:hypothetical protein
MLFGADSRTRLWVSLSAYDFTITGNQVADLFFGAPKGIKVLKDLVFGRRGTNPETVWPYVPEQGSGRYDLYFRYSTGPKVCEYVQRVFSTKADQTHFRSRREEKGRNDESCEWSLAMAMATMKLQVIPWLNGYESPQLDFIEHYTTYDEEFHNVECLVIQ